MKPDIWGEDEGRLLSSESQADAGHHRPLKDVLDGLRKVSGHCWHGGIEPGMGDECLQRCCRCGWYRTATLHEERDPDHGEFQPYSAYRRSWTYGAPRPTKYDEWRAVPGTPMSQRVTVPDLGCVPPSPLPPEAPRP